MRKSNILKLGTNIQTTTFTFREWGEYKFEIYRLGDGCQCFGPCDKGCAFVVGYTSEVTQKRACVSVRVEWDEHLWALEKGYYQLLVIRDGCPCEKMKIKIGERCGPVNMVNELRLVTCESDVPESIPNTPTSCCDAPVKEAFLCDIEDNPCVPWPFFGRPYTVREEPLDLIWRTPCSQSCPDSSPAPAIQYQPTRRRYR